MSSAWITATVMFAVWAVIVIGIANWLWFRSFAKKEKLSIDVETNMYVDELIGSDDNDGLSWEKAKKTGGFLQNGGELNADLTVVIRPEPNAPCRPWVVQGWDTKSGNLKIVGPAVDDKTEQAIREFIEVENQKTRK